ncbi:DUF6429 family protein [Mesorhizobium onobrychidis]|uniref:DUF6429 family protein n=1 Tax=Mesorhizobium onobrychidis TaxID=2775404 RepID=UPI0021574861|nr:DUF6429 family protein [Mesorhizobium onobrychidis]
MTLHKERCAWKRFGWDVTDRLHRKGVIADHVDKAKSLVLTEELFPALFTRPRP